MPAFSRAALSLSLLISLLAARADARLESRHRGLSQLQHKRLAERPVCVGDDPAALEKRDGTKYVFMHHYVLLTHTGARLIFQTRSRTLRMTGRTISRAYKPRAYAIALNMGADSWEPAQIKSAYAAATAVNSAVKLFISFDFTSFPCDQNQVISMVNLYGAHPKQFYVGGRPMISSFEGYCLGNDGWQNIKTQTNGYLMPFIESLEGKFNTWPSLDSWQCWGCAWPQGDYDKNTDDDQYYMSQLGLRYAATVSCWFFTHYNYKNYLLRADDWLLNSRWEQLMGFRSQLTFVEMISWNDYGESHYMGPIKGQEPAGTTWADGFPHTAWFDMSQYYIRGFQTGSYPAITQDVVYFWARPHPASATASGDSLPMPSGSTWTQDFLWAVAFATAPGSVTLSSGGMTQVNSVPAGVSKLKLALSPGRIAVNMIRSGVTILAASPTDYAFITNPVLYNYNVYVGAASATGGTSTSTSTSTSASSTPTATGWTYVGCYYDPSNPRVLPNLISSSQSQTVALCLAQCKGAGYLYGGTEYGIQCWCGAAITAGSSMAPAGDCSQPCAGKSTDVCGNGNRISVYRQITASSSSTSTSTSATPSGTPASSYVGCYYDPNDNRVLPTLISSSQSQNVGSCLTACSNGGYAYGGTEYGIQCWCGAMIASGASPAPAGDCSQPCAGKASDVCGSGNRISVYRIGGGGSVPAGWTYVACYYDPSSPRVLPTLSSSSQLQSVARCLNACGAAGFAFAGTEYGVECWCGGAITAGASVAPAGDCSQPCAGQASDKCGNANRISVYHRTS